MRLIYLETGAPGEGDDALNHARESEERVLFRTADDYSGVEECGGVYTDRTEIQEDYALRDVPVWTLDGAPAEVDTDQKRFVRGRHKGGGYYPVVDRKEDRVVKTATEEKAGEIVELLNAATEEEAQEIADDLSDGATLSDLDLD